MKLISCVIVEDEPASQEILKRYVSDCVQLELRAVCSNALEAGAELRKGGIDVLFLDINMPKLSGIDFYRSLINPPHVIFTTAYPEFAVNGFEVNAVDYLVKPFPFDRFIRAINKLTDIFQQNHEPDNGYIMLMADKKMHKVDFNSIHFIEGMGDYVKVRTSEKQLIVHQTLQKIHDSLPRDSFYRVHKSFIVSLHRLEYIEGNMAVVNKTKIPIGQTYRNDFLNLLQKRE
jgi:DNA-binding LytR/AlgR family response regulator